MRPDQKRMGVHVGKHAFLNVYSHSLLKAGECRLKSKKRSELRMKTGRKRPQEQEAKRIANEDRTKETARARSEANCE